MKLLITILFLTIFVTGCIASIEPKDREIIEEELETAPSSPISVKLSVKALTETATLGSETDLIVTVSSLDGNSYDGTTAQIDLPDGITLVDGDTSWVGNLENPTIFNARVKFEEIGNWTVTANAKYIITEDTRLSDSAQVCFSVSEDKITMERGECPAHVILPLGIKETSTERPTTI